MQKLFIGYFGSIEEEQLSHEIPSHGSGVLQLSPVHPGIQVHVALQSQVPRPLHSSPKVAEGQKE
jgi:hypothetical protein